MTKRLLVVGLGKMGGHHLRAIQESGLPVIADGVNPSDSTEAIEFLLSRGGLYFSRLDEALSRHHYDGAIVSATVSAHFDSTQKLLCAEIPTLLEKPMGGKVAGWLELLQLAREKETILLPGFTEASHFAWGRVVDLLPEVGRVRAVKTRRVGPRWWRPKGVDPLSDLAIHDLEHITSLFPDLEWKLGGDLDQELSRLRMEPQNSPLFVRGALVELTAGWGDFEDGARSIEIEGERGAIFVDWATGELRFCLKDREGNLSRENVEAFPNNPLVRQLLLFLSPSKALLLQRQKSATEAMQLLERVLNRLQTND